MQIELSEIKKLAEGNNQELLLAIYNLKTALNDQVLQLLLKIEETSKKLAETDAKIINRNNIENTQIRFNFTHMIIFIILGGIIGFGFSIFMVKIRPTKEYNKI